MVRPRFSALALALLVACTGGDGGETDQPETPRIDAPGIDARVELVAPAEEGTVEIPTFEWRPVNGADAYRISVLNADGEVIWAHHGPETSIVLGGVEDRPEGETGPIVTPGSRWSVVALAADGDVVAVSEIRPVSP